MDEYKLIRVTKPEDIDKRKLMDIYAESNRENTSFFCPMRKTKIKLSQLSKKDIWRFLKTSSIRIILLHVGFPLFVMNGIVSLEL